MSGTQRRELTVEQMLSAFDPSKHGGEEYMEECVEPQTEVQRAQQVVSQIENELREAKLLLNIAIGKSYVDKFAPKRHQVLVPGVRHTA